MDISQLNWLAVITATVSSFLLGGLWYSPVLFGNTWMKENGFTNESLQKANMIKIYGLSFIAALIMSVNLAMFLGPEQDIAFGAMAGFLAGFGWVAMSVGSHYLFERKSFRLFLINAGYSTIALTIMGIILGAWK